jgi:hypothetical protein
MITQLQSGDYRLVETRSATKILILDELEAFAWVRAETIGQILVYTKKDYSDETTLATGQYHLYNVVDEPEHSDHIHLDLEVGHFEWQGYILLTGLPSQDHPRTRIIPTHELMPHVSMQDHLATPLDLHQLKR